MIQKVKKGFTLVELVIVIAVIAILAAVLLPTFAGVLNRARSNERLQMATNARKEYFSSNEQFDTVEDMEGLIISVKQGTNDWYYYIITNGELVEVTEKCTLDETDPDNPLLTYTDTSAINYTEIELTENQVSHSTDEIKIYELVGTESSNNAPATPVYNHIDNNENDTIDAGDIIEFGMYPQSKATSDEVTALTSVSEVNGKKTLENGDVFIFVDNENDNSLDGWYKFESIRWTVLSVDNGTALLLSESIIDCQKFYNNTSERFIENKYVYANNYKYSDIRTWLNDEINGFCATAFTSVEQGIINNTIVDNSARSTFPDTSENDSNFFACENTEDKVFLLSVQEATKADYRFDTSVDAHSSREKSATTYAKSQGMYNDPYGFWWLRSASDSGSIVEYGADSDGFIGYDAINSDSGGVCPALYIRLD